MAHSKPSGYRGHRKPGRKAFSRHSRGNQARSNNLTESARVPKRRAPTDDVGARSRLPDSLGNHIVTTLQGPDRPSSPISSLVSPTRAEFLAEVARQFPGMPDRDRVLAANWSLARTTRLTVGRDTSLPIKERVYRGVVSYVRHRETDYDLNYKLFPDISREENLQMIRPDLDCVFKQFMHIDTTILDKSNVLRRSVRIAERTAPRIGQIMAPGLVIWLHSKNIQWPASPTVVNDHADYLAPGLVKWLRRQANQYKKSGPPGAVDYGAMASDLLSFLVENQPSTQDRVMEIDDNGDAVVNDDEAASLTVGQQALTPWVALPPELECRG